MVFYNRVIYVPAYIETKHKFFIADAFRIPPIKEKINSLSGSLTEKEVLILAREFYDEYQNRYKNDKEKWEDIKNNNYDIHCKTQAWRGNLKGFIKKWEERINTN